MVKHLHPNPKQKQVGVKCKLFGKEFNSIADAARYFNISHSWARECVLNDKHKDTLPEIIKQRHDLLLDKSSPNQPIQ